MKGGGGKTKEIKYDPEGENVQNIALKKTKNTTVSIWETHKGYNNKTNKAGG